MDYSIFVILIIVTIICAVYKYKKKKESQETNQETRQETNPEMTQEKTYEATQEATSEATQEATQEAIQEATQEAIQEASQEVTQEATQEVSPEASENITPTVQDALKEGPGWSAHYDGERWMGSLVLDGSETKAIGFWWINKETWDILNDKNASELICKGKCIYIFEEIRSVGIIERIYDADWKRLIQWHYFSKSVRGYVNYFEDYSDGTSDGMNVRFP